MIASKKQIALFLLLLVLFLVPGYTAIISLWGMLSEFLEDSRKLAPSSTVMVPMRDGVRLATDVFLPTGNGPWPVILIRTRYNKENCNPKTYKEGFPADLINKGYAFVVQDTRGRYASEGVDMIYKTDGAGPLQDGYDTCAWLTAQGWCNGKIGTLGNSALGITQCLMALARPPGLTCQVIGATPGDFYDDWAFPGDTPYGIWKRWMEDNDGLWLYGEGFNHYPRDGWWDEFDFVGKASSVMVPALHITGWYDIWTEGTIRRFQAWQTNGGTGAKGNQKLLIGPWGHSPRDIVVGCDAFPEERLPRLNTFILRFFDYWLKGIDNGLYKEPSCTYWEMMPPDECTEGGFLTTHELPQTVTKDFFLNDNQAISVEMSKSEGTINFTYDPNYPWQTAGGSNIHLSAGPKDQSMELQKNHHLLFITEPLKEKLTVTGEMQCRLYLESDTPCSDIAALVIDMVPDGRKIIVNDGIQKIRWSDSASVDLPITKAGEAVKVSIGWTSYAFLPGHRIGLVLTGGNWPRFAKNPQNGKMHFNAEDARTAQNTVYWGGNRASRLLLPVVSE